MPQSAYLKAYQEEKKRKFKLWLRDVKDRPCADCKVRYPYYVMQLDHVKEGKVDSVSRLVANRQYIKAMLEVAKCEVVCANCHATRTWLRLQNTGL